ncbi:MAG: hypothetical protein HOI43_11850 [Gammaproteobacteria bacterium]|nr:hypothetical protein [Gammaproteobacteria bacterium]
MTESRIGLKLGEFWEFVSRQEFCSLAKLVNLSSILNKVREHQQVFLACRCQCAEANRNTLR